MFSLTVKPEFDERVAHLKDCIESGLPSLNYNVLRHVIQHLHRVKQHSERNKMMASNLSVVFWPTLIRPNITNIDMLVVDRDQTTNLAEIMTTLIEYSHEFFGEDDTPGAATIVEIPFEPGMATDGQEIEGERLEETEMDGNGIEQNGHDTQDEVDDEELSESVEEGTLSTRRYTDL